MSSRSVLAALLLSALLSPLPSAAFGQQPAPLPHALEQVRLSIAQLGGALGDLNIQKWKTSSDVRKAMQANVVSMQHDIAGTLPTLISAAAANPAKVSTSLSVYRNVDALYDVLLRVTETAQLSGSRDAAALEQQQATLENSRTQLGEALLGAAQAQETELVRLRTVPVAPPAPAKPAHIVVDDGPATKPKPHHHRRTKSPASQTAPAATPATPPTAPQ